MKLNSPKIYKNRKAKNHPGIEIESNSKIWKNMTITHNPTKKNRYIVLKDKINPDDSRKSYVQKYLRKDPIKTRGERLKKYKLSENDLEQIKNYLDKNKKC